MRNGLPFLTIGDLSARDFRNARQFTEFSNWADFSEFCMERDGLALGYECAGVAAARQTVPFAAFLGWTRLTGAPLNLDGLDEFAAHWRYRTRHPGAHTRGSLGAPGKPELNAAAVGGAQTVIVREDVYALSRRQFAAGAPFSPPDLDAYAALIVDCCLPSSSRTRRPAVKIL